MPTAQPLLSGDQQRRLGADLTPWPRAWTRGEVYAAAVPRYHSCTP